MVKQKILYKYKQICQNYKSGPVSTGIFIISGFAGVSVSVFSIGIFISSEILFSSSTSDSQQENNKRRDKVKTIFFINFIIIRY
jgi:hypothetical protein